MSFRIPFPAPRPLRAAIVAAALLLVLGPAPLPAQGAVQQAGEWATIDWSRGIVRARGFGFVRDDHHPRLAHRERAAHRAAITDAQRNLAEAVQGVTIVAETRVRDLVAVSDQVKSGLRAYIVGAREVSVTYGEEGGQTTAEVLYEAPLDGRGGFASFMLPYAEPAITRAVEKQTAIETLGVGEPDWQAIKEKAFAIGWKYAVETPSAEREAELVRRSEPLVESTPAPAGGPDGDLATGILFDARDLDYGWSLFPVVMTEQEQSVFDVTVLTEAPDAGFFSPFAFSPEEGAKHTRTRANPVVIRAQEVRDGSLVISDEDGKKLLDLNGRAKLLEDGRVLFLIKRPADAVEPAV